MNHSEYHNPGSMSALLDGAIARFHASPDLQLLMPGKRSATDKRTTLGSVGERAIAHRLAVHLETELIEREILNVLPTLTIDCEYNRHGDAVKALHVQKELTARVIKAKRTLRDDPAHDSWYVFSVFPDIVVHQRGLDTNNLLIIELKRSTNTIDLDYDRLKLELFTATEDYGYRYVLGAAVVALENADLEKRCLRVCRLYHGGKPWASKNDSC